MGYSAAIKREVVKRYLDGDSAGIISKETGIAKCSIYRWAKVTSPKGQIAKPQSSEKLHVHCTKLEHEFEIIILTEILSLIPLKQRLDMLESLYKQELGYSVHELCEALNLDRSTFYNRIFRSADKVEANKKELDLLLAVQTVFNDNKQIFGAEKIRAVLADKGIVISTAHVRKIMDELGLQSIHSFTKKQNAKFNHQSRFQNLVKQEFSVQAPNQIWVSDFTEVLQFGVTYYISAILDLYSRKILGYKVSENKSTQLVTSLFKSVYTERGRPEGLIFHSDRGSQYTSYSCMKLMRKYGVEQSFSRSHKPHDNAVSETFFATLKKEEINRRHYSSKRDFYKGVAEYVDFYNLKRPHQFNNYKTPESIDSKGFADNINET